METLKDLPVKNLIVGVPHWLLAAIDQLWIVRGHSR
jgi:hypothetical protein